MSVPAPKEDTIYASNPFDDDIPSSNSSRHNSNNNPPPPMPTVSMHQQQAKGMGMPPMGVPYGGGYPPPGAPPYWAAGGGMPPQTPLPHDYYYVTPFQPTIPSNNAPPIHPCKSCTREIREDEQALQCAVPQGNTLPYLFFYYLKKPSYILGCNYWFHRQCVKITEMAYR